MHNLIYRLLKILSWSLLFCFSAAHAQSYYRLSGKVVDSENNASLIYANIGIANNKIGTISNQEGEFILKIPAKYKNDSLLVSYIGYETKRLALSEIFDNQLVIKLKPFFYQIGEVSINSNRATELLEKAFEKIPQNYYTEAVNFQAFYRENITENKKPVQLIEAVLKIYKGSYTDKGDKDQMKLIKGRQKKDVFPSRLWDYLFFIQGTYEALQSDIIKYRKKFISVSQSPYNFLKKKHFRYYHYSLTEQIDETGRGIYLIEFLPKSKQKRAVYEGRIFIDKQTLAILGMQYWFFPERINRTAVLNDETERFLNENSIETKSVDFYCEVFYKPYRNKWILSNVKIVYQFLFADYNGKHISLIKNEIDLLVSEIETENVERIPFFRRLGKWRSLTQQLGEFDEDFWRGFNFLKISKKHSVSGNRRH